MARIALGVERRGKLLAKSSDGRRGEAKSDCAYILVYERKTNQASKKGAMARELKKRLEDIKEVNLLKKFMFHSAYEHFMLSLLERSKDQTSTAKTALVYIFTTAIHSMSVSEEVYNVINMVKNQCTEGDIAVAREVVTMFSQSDFIKELITVCPKEEARRIAYSVLKAALERLNGDETNPARVLDLVNAFLNEVKYLPRPFCGQYFQILSFICTLDKSLQKHLANHLLVGITLEVLGVATKTKCQGLLKNKLNDSEASVRTFLTPIKDNLIALNDSDKVAQPKFPFELIYKLLEQSLDIDELQESLKLLQDAPGLGSLFKAAESSKVALNFLSLSLKAACESKPSVYAGPVMRYICYKLASSNIKELGIYYSPLTKLFTGKNCKEAISTVLNMMSKDFDIQPYTIATSYIDFIISESSTNEKFSALFISKSYKEFVDKLIRWLEGHSPPKSGCLLFRNSTKMWSQVGEDASKFCAESNKVRTSAFEHIKQGKALGKEFAQVKDVDVYSEGIKVQVGMVFEIVV